MKENCPTIEGIQKLRSQDIRIHCNTEEEAEKLRNIKWGDSYAGLTVRQSKFGFIASGISVNSINPKKLQDPEIIKEIERQNKSTGLQIMGMKTLRRKLKDDAEHYSLVIFVNNSEMADRCIKHGVYINGQRHDEIFSPVPTYSMFQMPAIRTSCHKMQKHPQCMR